MFATHPGIFATMTITRSSDSMGDSEEPSSMGRLSARFPAPTRPGKSADAAASLSIDVAGLYRCTR